MTSPRWTAVPLLPTQERFTGPPPLLPSTDEPVYSRLVADWRAAGRTGPGDRDRERVQLVASSTQASGHGLG